MDSEPVAREALSMEQMKIEERKVAFEDYEVIIFIRV